MDSKVDGQNVRNNWQTFPRNFYSVYLSSDFQGRWIAVFTQHISVCNWDFGDVCVLRTVRTVIHHGYHGCADTIVGYKAPPFFYVGPPPPWTTLSYANLQQLQVRCDYSLIAWQAPDETASLRKRSTTNASRPYCEAKSNDSRRWRWHRTWNERHRRKVYKK